ncbi:hypothetical protein J4Q44_G00338670 [Coregonus suidteri]|uniref:Transporter n=1 Tax=Coregonus suidteri TaxID=861788 RepID=A0AAN8KJX6_9TELE
MEERGHWGSKTEFLLAVAGNVVGLGNVWRFPYLCYKNGGGAFLVPYLVFVVPCGVPLFLLEMAMGQYTQEGGIACWKRLCPLAEGIGYAGQLILLYSCMCYIIILAWALFYPVSSFSAQLPWAGSTNPWNTGTYPGPAAPTPGTLGGMYVFQLFDYYACNRTCLLFLSVFESLAIGWIFGAERMYGVIEDMTGMRPNPIFKLCWLWFPWWALMQICTGTGSLRERFLHLCRPDHDHPLTRKRKAELEHMTSGAETEVLMTAARETTDK